jgi:hypothetical protein
MIVGVLKACHQIAVYVFFRLTEQHFQFLLHTLQLLYMWTVCDSTGLFKMIVGVLTTCRIQYTSDNSICIFHLTEQHFQFLLHAYRFSTCAPFVILQGYSKWLSGF